MFSTKFGKNLIPGENENPKYKFLEGVITKSPNWSYEKEWRIINEKECNGERGYCLEAPKPTEIYLGCKISPDYREQLINVATEKQMSIKQMIRIPNTYRLGYCDIKVVEYDSLLNEWVLRRQNNYSYIFNNE